MKLTRNVFINWLPLAVVTTAVCGLVYVAVQQSLRQSANDPQIQITEDAADALARGETPQFVLPGTSIDIARSLSPFLVVFDDAGNALASSGLLYGKTLRLPAGVLDNVRRHGESRLTLQPYPAVRIASVIVRVTGRNSGFVLSGRSLRETELRTRQVQIFVLIAWVAALAVSLLVVAVSDFWT